MRAAGLADYFEVVLPPPCKEGARLVTSALALLVAPDPDPTQVKEGFCYGHAWPEGELPEASMA